MRVDRGPGYGFDQVGWAGVGADVSGVVVYDDQQLPGMSPKARSRLQGLSGCISTNVFIGLARSGIKHEDKGGQEL